MDNFIENLLPGEELVTLQLRSLYEKHGYAKYTASKFEPYEIYAENRNFLGDTGMITFTDRSGRLMALKPDITTGMIKNTAPDARARKLYYCENVFRADRATGEFNEIRQTGLEYIGGDGSYAECEVVYLALESLDAISKDNILAISHMGYIMPLAEHYGLDTRSRTALLEAIKQKSASGAYSAAADAGIPDSDAKHIAKIAVLSGSYKDTCKSLRALSLNEAMRCAADETEMLCRALEGFGCRENRINIDMSVINDFAYYNGLVFRGYIRSIARSVLSGGRYDAMMRRLGKPQPAIGFALYLGELDRFLHREKKYDADVLLIYENAPAYDVACEVRRLTGEGMSVIAFPDADPAVKAKLTVRLDGKGDGKNA
ncbi:MAG TPA: ATP phosphoribosyltransferase regulatory subunit [Bacillota bacterium]|nr:ATP phosphoribosyltransferase regulatory subunit [Bacillota bacterium]